MKVTAEHLRELHARYLAGESPEAIGREVGYGRSGLSEAFRHAGLPLRPRGGRTLPLDDSRVQEAIRLWDEGMDLGAIAAQMHFAPKVLRRLLRESGRDTTGRRGRPKARLSECELKELHARYMASEPLDSLAGAVGLSSSGLIAAFRRNGLERQPAGPRFLSTDDPRFIEAAEYWDEGTGIKEASAVSGLSTKAFSRLLRESGRDPASRRRGPGHPNWRGGRRTTEDGYVWIRLPTEDPMASMRNQRGEVLEHRLVMARALGRPLTSKETVHHKDEPKTDNRLENLQLRNGNHGAGRVLVCGDCGSRNVVPRDL